MSRIPVLLWLAFLLLLVGSLPACGGLWGGQRAPGGVNLVEHDMTGDTISGLSVGSDQVIELTLVVSTETDSFELWAQPSAGSGVSGAPQLVAAPSGVAGQVLGLFWSTDAYVPGPYDLIARMPDGETATLAERVEVR